MTLRLVLFDLDGTLVDHEAASAAAVREWLAGSSWGSSGDLDAHVAAWTAIEERHFPAYRARTVSFLEQRRMRLRDFLLRFGIDASGWSDARLDEVFGGYLAAYERAWCTYPDAAGCLTVVGAAAQVGVLSNGDQAQQEDKLRRTGLLPLAGRVLTSDLLGVAKPFPEAFRRACEQCGVDVADAAYVGDRLDVDAEGSAAAGLRGIWLDRARSEAPTSLERIGSLEELPALLGVTSGRVA